MAARERHPAALFAISATVLFHLIALAHGGEPTLQILPPGETQTKTIGTSTMLTCKPAVDDVNIIEGMEWRDPLNRVIEPLKYAVLPIESTSPGSSKPAMYTEMHEGNGLYLYFNSLQEEQEGRYTCRATYAKSVPLNKSVTIETIEAITWEDAPLNQYPILNDNFSIVCKVRARPSPSVDWLFNGELIKTDNHYIIDTHVLRINNVQESDDGVYTCRASVPVTGELKERPIRVEVHKRPVIEELTSPIEIVEGETTNIDCKASGKPPPRYSWVKSLTQQNLSMADRFRVDADTGVLTITNVNRDDSGEYQCFASNAAGSANTNLMVNVIVKPKIMDFENHTTVQGNKATMVCKAFGRPPPHVTFRKHTAEKAYTMGAQDGDKIVLTNQKDEVRGETLANLTIHEVSRSDDGLYECVADNSGGVAHMNGHLIVEFPPSFAQMPNTTKWSWDQRPVNLTCIAESIPNATIRWLLPGDQKIDNFVTITEYNNGPVSTLRVIPTDTRFYTNYKCIAANRHGTREHIIQLREATRPGEIRQAKMAEITATTIRFELELPPTHPDLPIKNVVAQYKEDQDQWIHGKERVWSIGSPYVLEGLKPQTYYVVRFAAKNEVGMGNWGAQFRESTPGRTFPNEPKILTKPTGDYDVSLYSTQYELSWVTPPDNGEPIDFYEIVFCQLKRISGSWERVPNSCTTENVKNQGRPSHWLKDLKSDTFYSVELKAHNRMGFSTAGLAKFKTPKGVDTPLVHQGPLISSAAIIGIVIAILFIIIIIIDVICCCAHKTGIIYYVCERSRRKPVDEDDSKLGRDEKEPLKEEKKITPIIDSGLRRETSITFDGKRSVSKTGFVGKDSAV